MSEVVRVQAEIRPGNSSGCSTFVVTDMWGKTHEGYARYRPVVRDWVEAVWSTSPTTG